ncbi:MAG: restriction endonuclease subunit S [Bacteroidales bacterium]|nr:restriction endonuclease subunit S [Bacteroidales bacterium]
MKEGIDILIDKTNWKKYRFDEVCKQINVTSKKPETDGLHYVIGLEHIEPGNLHITKWETLEKETTFTRKFVKGQVLFGRRRAYQRKVAYAEFDGICSGDILVFEAIEENLIPELLPFLIQSDGFFEKALSTSAGSLSPRTKFKELADYEFLLPPKDEQKRLAELLWAADEMIEKEKLSFKLLEKLYHSNINSIFNSQKKYCKLGLLCNVKSGFAFPMKYQGYKGLPIPFFKVSDMNHLDNRYEMNISENYVDESILKSIKGQTFSVGSLIFPKIGATIYTDKKRLLSVDSIVDNNIMVLVPNKELLNPYFLYYFFNTFKLADIINTGAVPTISAETVRNIQIPQLDIEEQNSIVNVIESIVVIMKKQGLLVEESQQLKQKIINKIF